MRETGPIYDAVVVGGGPAGATAAADLAAAGREVALLDRAGRTKPCGGAVPPELLREFVGSVNRFFEARRRQSIGDLPEWNMPRRQNNTKFLANKSHCRITSPSLCKKLSLTRMCESYLLQPGFTHRPRNHPTKAPLKTALCSELH